MKIYAPALALGLSLLCNICPPAVMATDNASSAGASVSDKNAIDPKADALLHKVSDFYAGLKALSTTLVREGHKSGDNNVKQIKFQVEAAKPAKLSIKISGGNESFNGGQAKMDGVKLFLYNPLLGYVSSKAPSNFEDLVRDHEFQFAMAYVMHGQSFLEALLSDNPYQFMLQHYGINGGTIVGEEKIDGVKTEHLLLKSPRMAYDMWIDAGSKPWVRRVKHERSKQPGKNKAIVFNFKNSSDSTNAVASDFAFTAPAGAKEIETFFSQAKEAQKQAQQPTKQQEAGAGEHVHPLLNKPAPQLTLDTIGGGTMDLDSLKSKNIVVLDFWATWCPPCRAALPILAKVTKSYEAKGVKFFAIDLKEDQSKISDFLKKQGLNINVALDKDGQAAGKYGVEGIPQSVIIGKDGIVRKVHEGFSPDLKERLAAELDQILAGKETIE